MKKIIIILLAALFLVAAFMVVKELLQQAEDQAQFDELAALVTVETPKPATQPAQPQSPEEEQETEPATEPVPVTRDLTPLFDRNADCIGWIQIPGTQVNYPVMHTPREPERYLHKNFYGEYSPAGVPFMDGNCALQDHNRILYGHNMKNGTMFAEIKYYRDIAYWESHPTVEFQTAEGSARYAVFAVVQVKDVDDWYNFHSAPDQATYDRLIEEIKARSLYDTGITPAYGTQLLTLSTCYGAESDDRILVIAAQINET